MPESANNPKNMLCLAPEDSSWKMLPPYAKAFRQRGLTLHYLDWSVPLDTSLDALLSRLSFTPDYLFLPECGFPYLPGDLVQCPIPSIRLDVDTYAFTRRRIRWASLFDHVAVCHPGFDEVFSGTIRHPGMLVLPHAIDRELFDLPEIPREFELGWVGQVSGAFYRKREAWLPRLASEFKSNDWSRKYTLTQVADVYRRSRIVVNIARDDFTQDGNLRAFEALAAGALLITPLPSELTSLGLVPNEHFVPFHDESEISLLVRRYLDDEDARLRISGAGREAVLRRHTYDNRVDTLLGHLGQFGRKKLAPASNWPKSHVSLIYLDFYAGHGVLPCAKEQFRRIAGHGLRDTIEGTALLASVWWKHLSSKKV